MKLIVGLGNPGRDYVQTRHNAGWFVLDALAKDIGVSWTEDAKRHAWIAKGNIGSDAVILAKPTTYMNLSGQAVHALLSYYKDIELPTGLLIVHDELDLSPGQLKFTPKAGHGGHNGIHSIFESCGRADIARLRLGIGRPPQSGVAVDGWVLGKIESETVECATTKGVDALKAWTQDGLDRAMNTWNAA